MRPFLLLATRDHDGAARAEYEAVRVHAGLSHDELHHIRVESGPLPPDLDLSHYSGVLLGGSPFTMSDRDKTELQLRVEDDIRSLLNHIVDADLPFLGMCYGIGTVSTHLGGVVDTTYSEPVGSAEITLTEDGLHDPLLAGMPASFHAFVGHKEACNGAPPDTVVLATGSRCPIQMYRHGENVYVTQFHPELDKPGLEARIRVYQNAGYFPPEQMHTMIAAAHESAVEHHPHLVLRTFAQRYAKEATS